jgi:glycerophosphoryl diester phosphodiesterase
VTSGRAPAPRWQAMRGGTPLILGHRGASALETENTLAAFRRARADGADGVELDVVRCGSGEVVVFHDDDLARLAGRPERVRSLPLAELRRVALAGGGAIPTLDEALEELRGLLVNVELKASTAWGGQRLAPAVARIVARHGVEEAVLVSSFHPGALARFRAAAPAVRTGLLFHREQRRPLRDAWLRRALRPFALHPEHVLCTSPSVARWRAEGVAIHAWTVDDPGELRRVAALAVDGVITNDPGAARRALARGGPPLQ